MAITLSQSDADFEKRFAAFLLTKREASPDVDAAVREIIAEVRARGRRRAHPLHAEIRPRRSVAYRHRGHAAGDIDAAYQAADAATVEALTFARDRIRAHHQRQMPADDRYIDAAGVELGSRWTAIEAVGLYVPGGTASLSEFGADECGAGQVAGVRAHRDGGAGAGRA